MKVLESEFSRLCWIVVGKLMFWKGRRFDFDLEDGSVWMPAATRMPSV